MAGPIPVPYSRSLLWSCLALLLIGLYLLVGDQLRLSQWNVTPQANAALDEALAWKRGTFAMKYNTYEVAHVGDRCYNVVGLAFTLISVVATTLTHGLGGGAEEFHAPWFVAIVALPIPLLAYAAFLRQTRSPPWAAVLAGYLILATPLRSVLAMCGGGSIYYINHALAVTGLLLIADDLLGRQRIWPAVVGLALAAWSRQMTCFYALPILWTAWAQGRHAASEGPAPLRAKRRRRIIAAAGVALVAAVPMSLSAWKFGNPFDTGYPRMYAGRSDPISRQAQECFWGVRYVPMHAWAMNLAYPRWDIRGGALYAVTAHRDGAAIWLTSPLCLGVLLTARRWWRDPPRRALMLASLLVIAGLWGYHTTGSRDCGHYRYALDVVPVWLLVIAPYTEVPRGRRWTLACLAYGAMYAALVA